NIQDLLKDNRKLVEQFGARPISEIENLPNFYTFKRGLIYSHRDFDKFMSALEKGEKCAIVSGFNPSGTIHLGHKVVFDTILFFQQKYNVLVFVPISDDESYVADKIDTQENALKFAIKLAKEMLAYGYDPQKTYFIIDQIYTNIYNLAIKLSKKLTLSEVKATYGYQNEDNPGLFFYPAVQSAHIILPQEEFGIKNVFVLIGPDEDNHIRICRDLARRFGYNSPAILHTTFMRGLDGKKMSKSKGNAIFLKDDVETIKKKVRSAYSGGAATAEEQRKYGGDPEIDVACTYLTKMFLDDDAAEKLTLDFKTGKILSGEVKKMLEDKLIGFTLDFQKRVEKISIDDVKNSLLKNDEKSTFRLENILKPYKEQEGK
ncbi:MAG: tryptophan--tRNA ligase, partial [Euryarchaeota archaeon HGW-Euryarchaeota-1]